VDLSQQLTADKGTHSARRNNKVETDAPSLLIQFITARFAGSRLPSASSFSTFPRTDSNDLFSSSARLFLALSSSVRKSSASFTTRYFSCSSRLI
jgi:hypothetical protein